MDGMGSVMAKSSMMVELIGQRINEETSGGKELRYGGGAMEQVGWVEDVDTSLPSTRRG
jgi:hypothetical protein